MLKSSTSAVGTRRRGSGVIDDLRQNRRATRDKAGEGRETVRRRQLTSQQGVEEKDRAAAKLLRRSYGKRS